MKITPLILTKKNLIEAYNNRSILYPLLTPSVIVCVAYYILGTSDIFNNNFGIILGLAFVFGSFNDAIILAQEREKGTLAKLILSPISRWSITGGRILSSLLFSILSTTLVLTLGILIKLPLGFDVYLIALFYLTSSLMTLLTVSMGLLCSSICSSLRSTILLTSSLLIIFVILPSFIQNEPLIISPYNPFGNGYQVFNWILQEEDFVMIMKNDPIQQLIVQMSVVIIFLFTAANIAFRSKIR